MRSHWKTKYERIMRLLMAQTPLLLLPSCYCQPGSLWAPCLVAGSYATVWPSSQPSAEQCKLPDRMHIEQLSAEKPFVPFAQGRISSLAFGDTFKAGKLQSQGLQQHISPKGKLAVRIIEPLCLAKTTMSNHYLATRSGKALLSATTFIKHLKMLLFFKKRLWILQALKKLLLLQCIINLAGLSTDKATSCQHLSRGATWS